MTATTLTDTRTDTVTQSRALVGDALQGAIPALHYASRAELVAVLEASQQLINVGYAAQQQALAHLAAIDDVPDHDGDWVEQHRG